MGISRQKGFTIVEVSLFLAITGMLIAGVLFAIGGSLNAQRYRDATQSFKSLLQEQYSDLSNTQNSRTNSWTCNEPTAGTVNTGSAVRGQTNCLLIGKYVAINAGDIKIYNLVATQKAVMNTSLDDVSALRSTGNYRLNVSMVDIEQTQLDWGTRIAWPTSRTPRDRNLGIMFVRSPDSGRIYTFTSDTLASIGPGGVSATAFDSMLVASASVPGRGERSICVLSGGLTPNDNSISIATFADGASDIEMRSNDYIRANVPGGATKQC